MKKIPWKTIGMIGVMATGVGLHAFRTMDSSATSPELRKTGMTACRQIAAGLNDERIIEEYCSCYVDGVFNNPDAFNAIKALKIGRENNFTPKDITSETVAGARRIMPLEWRRAQDKIANECADAIIQAHPRARSTLGPVLTGPPTGAHAVEDYYASARTKEEIKERVANDPRMMDRMDRMMKSCMKATLETSVSVPVAGEFCECFVSSELAYIIVNNEPKVSDERGKFFAAECIGEMQTKKGLR
jgi:hypothetical protein